MSASESILNNVQNLVILRQEAPGSVVRALRALPLPPEAAGLLMSLDRGDAVLHLAGWPEPVLGHVTFVPPHRGSTATPDPQLDVVPARRLAELPEVLDELTHAKGELGRVRKSADDTPDKIMANVHDVLADWIRQPGKPMARIWAALGIDAPSKQKAIRKVLAPKFAQIRDERFGSAKVAILLPNAAGYALVGRGSLTGLGRGEVVHLHGAWWARDWAVKQGYEAHLEWRVGVGVNHPADVGYCADGVWHVIEVVDTSFLNLADAVRASLVLSTIVQTVTIVTKLKSEHARVRRLLAVEDLAGVMDRVQLSTFDFYLREVYP
ncbi:MAG TPA: hypothetical protein PKK06_05490 [Phycisphaerae bacterium]|nr:hypothetical protein [Phycisphaerae bacterium]HNU44789.1 hypothetical protein [Phycisphaerae bacterium]